MAGEKLFFAEFVEIKYLPDLSVYPKDILQNAETNCLTKFCISDIVVSKPEDKK